MSLTLGSALADSAIGVYQRYVSPYKGFRCAHGVYTGRRSCSAYARGIVRRLGAGALREAMPRKFARCRAAYAVLLSEQDDRARMRQLRREARGSKQSNRCDHCGDACDVGELGCEVVECLPSSCCDAGLGDCGIGACDCSL